MTSREGDRVAGQDGATGVVIAVAGDRARVAWDHCGDVTWSPLATLRVAQRPARPAWALPPRAGNCGD